jgi:hypothetical protein
MWVAFSGVSEERTEDAGSKFLRNVEQISPHGTKTQNRPQFEYEYDCGT